MKAHKQMESMLWYDLGRELEKFYAEQIHRKLRYRMRQTIWNHSQYFLEDELEAEMQKGNQ